MLSNGCIIFACAIVVFAVFVSWNYNERPLQQQSLESETEIGEELIREQRIDKYRADNQFQCWFNYREAIPNRICKRICENGSFSLPGMNVCIPWLNCKDLTHVDLLHQIGSGAVKKVYLGIWNGKHLAVSIPKVADDGKVLFEKDFGYGLQMRIQLGPHNRLSQLVGFCKEPLTVLTEYYESGPLSSFRHVLESDKFIQYNSQKARFQLCLDYVEILAFFHSSPIGARAMCDSSDLQKTFQQYLLTDDFRVVVNDLDALPKVDHSRKQLIKCGHRQLIGQFVAPEQRWPFDIPFDDVIMPLYDEKIDVWKIPSVCETFLYHSDDDLILFRLFTIHKKCKSFDPKNRPTAAQVFQYYLNVWEEMFSTMKINH